MTAPLKESAPLEMAEHIPSGAPKAAPAFMPGMRLCQDFYYEVVEPLMRKHFPDLKYSAGLVGHGSEVLGFDSPTSIDHNWGPRVVFFFSSIDYVSHHKKVDEMLRTNLPYEFKGFPTSFQEGDIYRKDTPILKTEGPVNHLCSFFTAASFFKHYLGYDISKKKQPTFQDWLLFPQQALIEITAGKLFHDDLNIQALRDQFSYYPDTIWKYMMRVQWGKILDSLQMQARTGEVYDELGSRIIASEMCSKIMTLCFLLERRYMPYSKWRGTAFSRWLSCASVFEPLLLTVIRESSWMRRQELLAKAYQTLGRMHNGLKITEPVSTKVVDFFGRGYPIIDAWKYVEALEEVIDNPQLKAMKYPLGAVDQFIDHTRINQLNYFYVDLKDVIK